MQFGGIINNGMFKLRNCVASDKSVQNFGYYRAEVKKNKMECHDWKNFQTNQWKISGNPRTMSKNVSEKNSRQSAYALRSGAGGVYEYIC